MRAAAKVEALENGDHAHGFLCVGFIPLSDREPRIGDGQNIWGNMSLPELVREQNVEEIVVAEPGCEPGVAGSHPLAEGVSRDIQSTRSGIEMLLGRDDVVDKMQRFLTIDKLMLAERRELIARVDLRYSNGMAVAWREPATVETGSNE